MKAHRVAGLCKDFFLVRTGLCQFKCSIWIGTEYFENIAYFDIAHCPSSALDVRWDRSP